MAMAMAIAMIDGDDDGGCIDGDATVDGDGDDRRRC